VADDPAPNDAYRFEMFVREYQDMVFATAVRLLGNAAEAEDVSQTVFMRAYERFATISNSPTAAGWLKTVATNLCLNHLARYRARWQFFSELERDDQSSVEDVATPGSRAEARKSHIVGGDPGGSHVVGPPDFGPMARPAPSPLEAVEQSERAARLEQALRGLPDHQRVPLVLFHFEDMSYEAIASMLGVTVGKVKIDIHRGRARLRKQLAVFDGRR
jgi:RNA polymerase sigma-70 factor (ECF subfamily)